MATEFVGGNRLTLLSNGSEYFPALIAAIDAARREVHLETYLFADDATGQAVADALSRAAARGVRTRLLIDGFGARNCAEQRLPLLLAAGVQALVYRPEIARFSLHRQRLRRLHRKLALIDGTIGFVGGINIIDDMNTPRQTPPRIDYAARIEGPLLASVEHAMRRLWNLVAFASLNSAFRIATNRSTPAPCGSQRAAFIVRDNLRHRHAIESAYLEAIANAREDILIASAYFLPGRRFRHALRDAAARGVRVRLLLQARVEFPLLHYATQALYAQLLAAGIGIHLYERSFLHAKVAVIDDNWATVGSSNIDPFSLLLAREGNLLVEDGAFAGELRQSLLNLISDGARELPPGSRRQLSWPARLLRRIAYALISLAIGLLGSGRRRS
ncbi:cardiolipin synthase ClsB [Rhodocyclus tenuis]|uniref:Cardiolipin synthase B n=1 Tax=Rhodocyclus tenuis TaxID=1066 RepID=A0A840FVY7_RHOTE|nr:cardiolipin synthase ClsB [Rhodocyclus tenuis]MBB4246257.1 cardiolipin synthase [Rhodocyclus tenuis]